MTLGDEEAQKVIDLYSESKAYTTQKGKEKGRYTLTFNIIGPYRLIVVAPIDKSQ
jgi:hypothetical protein